MDFFHPQYYENSHRVPGDEPPSGSLKAAHCDSACLWIKCCAGCSTSVHTAAVILQKGHTLLQRQIHPVPRLLNVPHATWLKACQTKKIQKVWCNASSHVDICSCVFSTFYQHTKYMHWFDQPYASAKLQELSALLSEFHVHNESVTPVSASLDGQSQ